jgi:hypothetical protein
MLLVTTTQAVFVLDFTAGRAWQISAGQGVYYGASFDRDHIYVAARQAHYGGDKHGQRNAILVFDRDLALVGVERPDPPLRDVHQIVATAERLFCAGSFDDAILVREKDGSWSSFRPLPPIGPGGLNQHHVNSVFVDADGIWLSGTKPSGHWARLDHSGALLAHAPLGDGTHNVWRHGGDTWVLSSREGAAVSAGGARLPIREEGWVRGLAGDGEGSWYVGVCQNRIRRDRAFSDCSIARIDPATGAATAVRPLRGYGMVHDIRLLGAPDPLHNGIAFAVDGEALEGRFLEVATDEEWAA